MVNNTGTIEVGFIYIIRRFYTVLFYCVRTTEFVVFKKKTKTFDLQILVRQPPKLKGIPERGTGRLVVEERHRSGSEKRHRSGSEKTHDVGTGEKVKNIPGVSVT